MEEMYGLPSSPEDYSDKAIMTPDNLIFPADYQSFLMSSSAAAAGFRDRIPVLGSEELLSAASAITEVEASVAAPEFRPQEDSSSVIKARIASHPNYPRLIQAYIDCQKVGAPPEIACLLDEIRRENDLNKRDVVSTCFGDDRELDEFMETYCDVLLKYKSDLARPFDEATSFLNKIETQLTNLCSGASLLSLSEISYGHDVHKTLNAILTDVDNNSEIFMCLPIFLRVKTYRDDDGGVSSEEDFSTAGRDTQDGQAKVEDQEIKDRLLRKFGSRIASLKLEFSKKKKKGKLPKEARQALLEWWSVHYKWPYPTESDKIALAKSTGLDQKQINNWFINQRKRHWKPSENISAQFSAMDNLTGLFFTDE